MRCRGNDGPCQNGTELVIYIDTIMSIRNYVFVSIYTRRKVKYSVAEVTAATNMHMDSIGAL